jgi:hypothetical protein
LNLPWPPCDLIFTIAMVALPFLVGGGVVKIGDTSTAVVVAAGMISAAWVVSSYIKKCSSTEQAYIYTEAADDKGDIIPFPNKDEIQ